MLPFEVLRMQYLSLEIILSCERRELWHVIGTIGNNQLVERFSNFLAIGCSNIENPFLLLLVAIHSDDFGL